MCRLFLYATGLRRLPSLTTGSRLYSAQNDHTRKRKKTGKKPAFSDGAVEKTRTSTGCPTATSTLRVYQFRHDRIVVDVDLSSTSGDVANAFRTRKSLFAHL